MIDPAGLEVFHQNHRVVIAAWNDILISIWKSDVEVSDVAPAETAQAALMARHPRFGSLALAEKGALRMSSEARQEAARITNLAKGSCCAIALVIAVDGFAGAAIRAAVTGVHLLSRNQIPQRSFDSVPPAATWMFEKLSRDRAGLSVFLEAYAGLRK